MDKTSFNEYINYLLSRKRYLAEAEHKVAWTKNDTPVLSHAEFGEWVYPDKEAESEKSD
jgi:hypothetical protein